MAFERRSLRPFDALEKTQTLLNHVVRLQCPPIPDGFQPLLGEPGRKAIGVRGEIAEPGRTLVLNHDQYVGGGIGLYFGVNEDDWLQLTKVAGEELSKILGPGRLGFATIVVTVTNNRLKMIHKVLELTFDQWTGGDWRVLLAPPGDREARPRPLRMPADGCVVRVSILLNRELPTDMRAEGRPWRKGSWLAGVDIKISAGKGTGLAPRVLDAAIREKFLLGEHTSSFVDIHAERSGICWTSNLAEVMTVYIDEDLLKSAAEMTSPDEHVRAAGGPLITRWVMDTYRALIQAYSADDQLADFDPDSGVHEQTVLYSMLLDLEEKLLVNRSEALLILREQPSRFTAMMEHVVGLKMTDQSLLELKG
jgi:hypothetical protein